LPKLKTVYLNKPFFNMFHCRMCSENPFVRMFVPEEGREDTTKEKKSQSKHRPKKGTATFKPRSEEAMQELLDIWAQYVHPRARDSFGSPEELNDVLIQLAISIHETEDPILGDEQRCVIWYGHVADDTQEAVVRLMKPGDQTESITYVNRLLAFIFATDESFEQLMKQPKVPFKMKCKNQICVNLHHISV